MATLSKNKVKESNKPRISSNIIGIILGLIWLLSSILIYKLYNDSQLTTFTVPRIIMPIYDIFGIEGGSLVQGLLGICLIVYNINKIIKTRRPL